MKDIGGKKRLSGEGLETKDAPGVLAGGGMWPVRSEVFCIVPIHIEQPTLFFQIGQYVLNFGWRTG